MPLPTPNTRLKFGLMPDLASSPACRALARWENEGGARKIAANALPEPVLRRHAGRWLPFHAEVGWTIDGQVSNYWRGTMTSWAVS